MKCVTAVSICVLAVTSASAAIAQSADSTHDAHMHHMHGVEARGDQEMGFSHLSTAHHFLLYADGGAIQVTANAATDSTSIEHIRSHLPNVAASFAKGDFSMPMFIHDTVPPGAAIMKKRRSKIRYQYESLEAGGRVRITTKDPKALAAVHDFLKFQIRDHATGDPLEVQGMKP